ncbi:MAG TPA: sugar ABC transporter ATP-binding protein [Erysipelotrichaceae bacterium]|nr:sugar ABC transporter ATP-binding protein [Erysipelotrichaceae bacterium]
MSEYILQMKNMRKEFPGVVALDDVQLNLKPGTVHALMGENGAGKSTLMKTLFGIYKRDKGTVIYQGEKVEYNNAKEGIDAGISMIHQELNPIRMMTVGENIFLGRYPMNKYGLVDHHKMYEDTQKLLDQVGLDIDPKTLLNDLTVSQMQSVEIAKAVSQDAKIVIMDEPTSSLTQNESAILFNIIETLRARGIGIIYISHKMDEILQISDEVTILRDGKYVGTWPASELTNDIIIKHMVGRELTGMFPEKTNVVGDEVVFKVENMTSPNPLSFKDAHFELKKGEILGVGGLVGAQRTEFIEAIYGLRSKTTGTMYLNGEKIEIGRPKDAIRLGIALLTEDRRHNGIFGVLSVEDNVAMASIDQFVKKNLLLDEEGIRKVVQENIDQLDIKTPSHKTQIKSLSGGNQQKVIISRWLANNPDILILDEPTRGIDVGAKFQIYEIIDRLAASGKSIIMISSEMPELLGISDRIMVMCEGRVSGFLDAKEATQEDIMDLATRFM